jgi:hypothetical protein
MALRIPIVGVTAFGNSSWEWFTLHKLLITSLLLLLAILPGQAPATEWQFDGVSRIVAISDVHGAYDAMVDALKAAEIIDNDLAWIGGDSHLVITGDILDRGPDSRPAMDLLMRLEDEAEVDGGRVHVLIGNHEAMNLVGDLRYVSAGEYAAFAAEEKAEERERWFGVYAQKRSPPDQTPEGVATVFRQKFPDGFFAHRRAFGTEGKYGEWLLDKPAVVVINRTAFAHGGLSPLIGEIGLDGVNVRLIGEMGMYVQQLEIAYQANALLPTDNFHDHPGLVTRFAPPLDASHDLLRSIDAIKELNASDLHSLDGPLWYRGNVVCSELIEYDKLTATLDAIGADRVVVGHTPTPGRTVVERLDGKLVEIDTGMLNNYYGGSANALIIDGSGEMSVVNQDGETRVSPTPHPRNVGMRPQGRLSHGQIETLLKNGEITSSRKDKLDRDVYTLSDGAASVEAVFQKRKGRGFYPEVAAYRLDLLINLEMVPVAVVREVDGKDGSLQFVPKSWIDESKRQQDGSGGSAWCALPEQWNAMTVWDVLIYNEGRNANNILYSMDFWQVMLVGHDNGFTTRKGVPPRFERVPYEVGQGWRNALAELTEETLAEALGDVMDEKRIRALAARAAALAEE